MFIICVTALSIVLVFNIFDKLLDTIRRWVTSSQMWYLITSKCINQLCNCCHGFYEPSDYVFTSIEFYSWFARLAQFTSLNHHHEAPKHLWSICYVHSILPLCFLTLNLIFDLSKAYAAYSFHSSQWGTKRCLIYLLCKLC